ncbi:MAG TPA: MarC family protein [Alphaproteobacteria bacterium]|nr:MarC family protein [Alphaproteobacteria bacterium]
MLSGAQQDIGDAVNSFLLVYAALFPIVNPLGAAPVFISLTRHMAADMRHALAWRIALNGFLLLLGSLFVGSHVLEFFGITLPVVRIAGGLVVAAMGWKLLNEGDDPQGRHAEAPRSAALALKDAFYPLTMPLTVGPGSISVAITLGSEKPKGATDITELAFLGGAAIAGLVGIAATIYVCYRFADRIEGVLGEGGMNVVVRLSAFILLCIGFQIIWSGYTGLEAPLPH